VISLFETTTTKNKKEIIKAAQNGNEEAIEYLIEQYMDIVYHKAKFFYINGQGRDDVIQEGRIGLYKAIKYYNIDGKSSFNTFCNMCVYRQLVTAIKRANRDKRLSLNHSTSMDKPFNYSNGVNPTGRSLNDIIPDEAGNVEEDILSKEFFDLLFSDLKEYLTELEWDVFKHYLDDRTYKEIAKILEVNTKCVDNALQRVREKTGEMRPDYNLGDFID